jgi:hypothetical protein
MTTLHLQARAGRPIQQQQQEEVHSGQERRQHRRYDMEMQSIQIDRWDGAEKSAATLGTLLDLSAGGMRIRTGQKNIQPDHQIRVRVQLPAATGICPFVDTTSSRPQPKREWVGWMNVVRVNQVTDRTWEVAGPLLDMEEMDRGMLGLYLSTQAMAA